MKRSFSTLILAVLVGLPIAAGTTLPDTPAGQALSEWLTAFSAGEDQAALKAFLEQRFSERMLAAFPMEQHLAIHRSMLEDSGGGVTPVEVVEADEHEIAVRCQAANGDWMLVRLQVAPEPPHRIEGVGLRPTDSPEMLAIEPAADDAALAVAVREYVDGLAAAGAFSGAVLVAHRGLPVVEGAWGEANRRYGVANHVDTRFNLGSMNKMFTAVAVARLVEAGKLDWDDTVGKHLPDYPNDQVRDGVRVRHLLSHTSGMGSHFTEEFMEGSKLRFREPADYLPLFVDEPLAFAPGERFSYSNAGFYVLGMLIEAASGESYHDFVRDQVYRPAGMGASDSYAIDVPVANLAMGYYEEDGEWRENTLLHSVKGGPAGGGYATVGDLNRFAGALLHGKLIRPETLDVLTTAHAERDARGGYGYGFGVHEEDGVRWFGHSGGFPGINGALHVYPELGYTVAVLANIDGAASPVARHLRRLLPR